MLELGCKNLSRGAFFLCCKKHSTIRAQKTNNESKTLSEPDSLLRKECGKGSGLNCLSEACGGRSGSFSLFSGANKEKKTGVGIKRQVQTGKTGFM